MYHRPIVAKLGQVYQLSVKRYFKSDSCAASCPNRGAVLPNLPRSELQIPDFSELVESHEI